MIDPASHDSEGAAVVGEAIDADAVRAERQRQEAEEIAAVKHWRARIAAGRSVDYDEHQKWKEWRKYAAGRQDDWLVNTNLIQSTIEALLPFIYARDPDFAVTPEESVGEDRFRQVRQFALTLQQVLSRLMRDGGLKGVMQRAVVSAMTAGQGWAKLAFQFATERDPLIERRMADIQDNLARIAALQDDLDDTARVDADVKREELRAQLMALDEQVEIQIARGLAIDVIQAEDIQVDPALRELSDYQHADWIAHRIWMTPDKAKATFPTLTDDQLKAANTYHQRCDTDGGAGSQQPTRATSSGASNAEPGWVAVWEIWDRQASVVRTLIEGVEVWARDPYAPSPVGKRFYPLFMIAFHHIDGLRQPIADVEFWRRLQDEYARARSQWAAHRRRAIPARVGFRDSITPEDAKRLTNPDLNELILIERLNPTDRAQDMAAVLSHPAISGELYNVDPIRQDLEMVSGLQDANRGSVVRAKTATEADILQQGALSRISKRVDDIEAVLTDMAQYAAELALQALSPEEAMRIAGPESEWPQLSKDDLYSMVSIQIRAGSAGKPNTAAERESWTELLPIIRQSVIEIVQLRQQGQMALAQAATELLRETLRRADERLDLDRFLPPAEATPPPVAPAIPQPGQIDAGLPPDIAPPVQAPPIPSVQ